MDDELWFHGLIDDQLQGATFGVNLNIEMRTPEETPVAASLWRLLQLGIYDLADNEGKWPGSTRSQHFTASVAHRLWFLLRAEQKANRHLKREVKETKAEFRRLVQEQADHNCLFHLITDMLRTTFESEMLQMREEHNRLVASIKDKDNDIARDFREADRRLNCHRREINELHTKVNSLDDALPMLGAHVDSMSNRLCHCRSRSSAAVHEESEDKLIPDRMASPASEGSYHTPMRVAEEIEEVVRETSKETAVNPTSSSPELEYEEENQVAIPVPPPSISPCVGCRPAIRTSSSEVTSTDLPSYQDATLLQCRLDHGELVPVESVNVNDLTALTLSSVRRAEVTLTLVTSLSDRMAEWSAERSRIQAQTSLDLARERLRAELHLAIAHRLEADWVVAMVDEGIAESALEEVEGTASVDEAYWGAFQG